MRIRDDDALAEPEFGMAPLIDIVFQLLIFFMVASSFQKDERRLDLELPDSSTATRGEAPLDIVVDVSREGRVFVAGSAVEDDELVAALSRAAAGRGTTPVTVRGDRLAHHERIVRVLDACGLAGLSNLSVATVDGGEAR